MCGTAVWSVDYGAETSAGASSNQFWTVSLLVAVKTRIESFDRILREVCCLYETEKARVEKNRND